MKRITALLFSLLLLAACSRTGRQASAPASVPPPPRQETRREPLAAPAAAKAEQGTAYLPSRERVLARGDKEQVITSWQVLGATLPSAKSEVLYGLLVAETAVLAEPQRTTGKARLERLSRVEVLDTGEWERDDSTFRRSYTVKGESGGAPLEGSVDSSAVALITTEAGELAAGFLERKIAIAGGESAYNVLAIAEGKSVTLADTSAWIFPDSFHPSGVLRAALEDVNSDGAAELVLEAETIVSLHYLGATPLRWEAWLRRTAGGWAPIFQYSSSFATDEGDSYTATQRGLDSRGSGFVDTVKVTMEHEQVTEEAEFRNTIISFFVWNGSVYRKDGAQELPRQGTVTAEEAALSEGAGPHREVVETLRRGELLYVFDRSDERETLGETAGFWYHVLTKGGVEGWVHGANVELSWIDPLKVNREVWLGKPGE